MDEIWYKKIQRRAKKLEIIRYHRFKFQVEVEIKCIFHFTILHIGRSNCFDIINSFCSTGTLTN